MEVDLYNLGDRICIRPDNEREDLDTWYHAGCEFTVLRHGYDETDGYYYNVVGEPYNVWVSHKDVVPRSITKIEEHSSKKVSVLDIQHGGDHYKNRGIQPIEYVMANELGFCEGNIVKYASRHEDKNGAEDIRKVIHYAQFILKFKYGEEI